MRVVTLPASGALAADVRGFRIVATGDDAATRVLLPDTVVIVGLRYSGAAYDGGVRVPDATVAGMRDTVRSMHTSAHGGVVLAQLRPGRASLYLGDVVHELFGTTIALEDVLPPRAVERASARVREARTDEARVRVLEALLLEARDERRVDPLVVAAARAIERSTGSVRVAELIDLLGISRDRLEKRFRRVVGATPKQFASLVRLNRAVALHRSGLSLTRAAFDAGYFDQSHFIRAFRDATGMAPRDFMRGAASC